MFKHKIMADFIPAVNNGKRKTIAPRIDLTPMVDLGFLLITFFMYTTTMIKPKVMDINMPVPGKASEIPEESTITLIQSSGHLTFMYKGTSLQDMQILHPKDIRTVIIHEQQQVRNLPATFSDAAHKLHVIIKPDNKSTYEDLVNLLDEMNINKIPYYSIADIAAEEQNILTEKLQTATWKE